MQLVFKWDDTAVQETLERFLLEIHRSRGVDFVDDLLRDFNTELDTTASQREVKAGDHCHPCLQFTNSVC